MADHDDPYHRRGLRLNPFAYGDAELDAAGWADRGLPPPAEPGQRRLVQVIGVSGAGKTTTLRRWAAAAPGPWYYVPRGPRRLRPLPIAPLVYWDEANRAPAVLRRRALRTAARLGYTVVAGTHDDLTVDARVAGLVVDTITLSTITAADLTDWAAKRFAASSAGDGTSPQWRLPGPVAADIAARAGTSWRTAGDLLHAWVAREVADHAAHPTE